MRRLWYNGNVTSMDSTMRRYEALGTEEDRIIFLGTTEEGLRQSWDETNDLNGMLMLPGFSDTHMHMLYYGMFRINLPLFGVNCIEDMVALGRARIAQAPPTHLIGMGWNQDTMREGRLLERRDMDLISTEIPICMLRACGHVAACNSVMMAKIKALPHVSAELRAHIDFERGILREDAMRLYLHVVPPMDETYVRGLVQVAQKAMNAAGITCVHSDDLHVIPGMDPIDLIHIFRTMEAAGALTLRIYEQCLVEGDNFPRLLEVRSSPLDCTSLFRTGPRKLLQDGSLGAKSAEMSAGYQDNPQNHGIPIYSPEELFRLVRQAHDAHMSVAVHAIGDLALAKVLDAIESAQQANPWPNHRHGIVHAQITNKILLRRMVELGVQAYIQPIFIDADMGIIESRIGADRAKECYCWKTMIDMGIHTSGGSDCPVEPFNILDNIRAAVTRKRRDGTQCYLPDQALSVEEAVRLFTADAAWPSFDEAVRGTLELGKLADCVVLSENLFSIPPDLFPRVHVMETILNGATVYCRAV